MIKNLLGIVTLLIPLLFTAIGPVLAAGETLSIAMVLWRGPTEADRGFKDGLKKLGYSVTYTTLDAKQDRTRLGTLLRNELGPNLGRFDYVYSYGTTASKTTKTFLNNRIPHVFSNVADPVRSKVVRSLAASGENICGTTNRIPVAVQIEEASKIFQIKKLGIIFNPRESNAMLMRQELYDFAKSKSFEVVDFRTPPARNRLQAALKKLIAKPDTVDAVYLPLDSFVLTKAKEIGSALRTAGVKTIGALKKFMTNGALLGVVPDYYRLGGRVADIVHRHRKGEPLADIPIAGVERPTLVVNRKTAKMLNVTFSKNALAGATFVD